MPANAPQYFVYIMTNKNNSVLYPGVTGDLVRRVNEHREGTGSGFTARFSATKLVYFEMFDDSYTAIVREKQIKAGSRAKKVLLIESMNHEWEDLYPRLLR